jgi:hypothetical protein
MENQHLQDKKNAAREISPIAIYALATHLPASKPHKSLLGSVVRSAYNHLYQPAGNFSRPSIVRRGVTSLASPVYEVPTAEDQERTADLASQAVGMLLAAMPQAKDAVSAIFHTQCTLDQQIMGSVCLRIQDDHFAQAELTMMIGQLGTAGIPTVFRLASLSFKSGRPTCISACDKWISPFVRSVPGLLTHADASAACLAGKMEAGSAPIAVIENIVTSCVPLRGDLWSTPVAVQRQYLLDHVQKVIEALLSQHPDLQRDELVLIGDGYGNDFAAELGAALCMAPGPGFYSDIHLSSASPLFAVSKAIGLAAERDRSVLAVIWTVSQSGHAAAILLRACVGAVENNGVWLARRMSAPQPNSYAS